MGYIVTTESLDSMEELWKSSGNNLEWPSVFVIPPWLKSWWQVFQPGNEMYVRAVRRDDTVIGLAPLMSDAKTAFFIGDTDVCDYLDFIIAPGEESAFYRELWGYLKADGLEKLDLKHIRDDSSVIKHLLPLAEERGYRIDTVREDVSLEIALPDTFEAYLESLNSKQRHEVRRKLRRLNEAGDIEFRFIDDSSSLQDSINSFLKMFTESRNDKADFLTGEMKSYFIRLSGAMAEAGLMRFGKLTLDDKLVAEIMCFEFKDCMYLYNSGYDPEYTSLSAGLLSKVLAIKDCIEKGNKKFDFLKGGEPYKYRLGGQEVPLYRCTIDL